MDTHTAKSGLLEVTTPGRIFDREGALVIDFTSASSDVTLELNGVRFSGNSTADLAAELRASGAAGSGLPISIPYDVTTEGLQLMIGEAGRLAQVPGAYLTGAAAQAAVDKASRIVGGEAAWPLAADLEHTEWDPDALIAGSRWDGPLVVSMPRTGSTLMGMLFLFCRDSDRPGGYRFDRYVHEPVAPVFWRGDDLESVGRFLAEPLSERDIVQESAYQFADPRIARWFLARARSPIIFTMRHPQLAWPSRWRALLAQRLDEDPADPSADEYRVAIEESDFSRLGDFLTQSVRPADNGFYAFISLIGTCLREGIDFVIVDNTRFRSTPEATMRALCERLDIGFDREMVEWTDLQDVLPRVVMSDLARGDEYRWYYEGTLQSSQGIEPETSTMVDRACVPQQLSGTSDDFLTIDEAVTWYQLLLSRPETLP